ncbi:hypothetical protein CALCODRAFT_511479 [Calocera cornea HHB12733]|uniref:Uncharacterized protein n=1 Tax=Calocera cornea HHB12733 TaxID=1353952 RepID=A0A165DQU5_9BASI|nr:hypothetical protein CALCODRAFT_511479 [Calocera cornea HHB12733]
MLGGFLCPLMFSPAGQCSAFTIKGGATVKFPDGQLWQHKGAILFCLGQTLTSHLDHKYWAHTAVVASLAAGVPVYRAHPEAHNLERWVVKPCPCAVREGYVQFLPSDAVNLAALIGMVCDKDCLNPRPLPALLQSDWEHMWWFPAWIRTLERAWHYAQWTLSAVWVAPSFCSETLSMWMWALCNHYVVMQSHSRCNWQLIVESHNVMPLAIILNVLNGKSTIKTFVTMGVQTRGLRFRLQRALTYRCSAYVYSKTFDCWTPPPTEEGNKPLPEVDMNLGLLLATLLCMEAHPNRSETGGCCCTCMLSGEDLATVSTLSCHTNLTTQSFLQTYEPVPCTLHQHNWNEDQMIFLRIMMTPEHFVNLFQLFATREPSKHIKITVVPILLHADVDNYYHQGHLSFQTCSPLESSETKITVRQVDGKTKGLTLLEIGTKETFSLTYVLSTPLQRVSFRGLDGFIAALEAAKISQAVVLRIGREYILQMQFMICFNTGVDVENQTGTGMQNQGRECGTSHANYLEYVVSPLSSEIAWCPANTVWLDIAAALVNCVADDVDTLLNQLGALPCLVHNGAVCSYLQCWAVILLSCVTAAGGARLPLGIQQEHIPARFVVEFDLEQPADPPNAEARRFAPLDAQWQLRLQDDFLSPVVLVGGETAQSDMDTVTHARDLLSQLSVLWTLLNMELPALMQLEVLEDYGCMLNWHIVASIPIGLNTNRLPTVVCDAVMGCTPMQWSSHGSVWGGRIGEWKHLLPEHHEEHAEQAQWIVHLLGYLWVKFLFPGYALDTTPRSSYLILLLQFITEAVQWMQHFKLPYGWLGPDHAHHPPMDAMMEKGWLRLFEKAPLLSLTPSRVETMLWLRHHWDLVGSRMPYTVGPGLSAGNHAVFGREDAGAGGTQFGCGTALNLRLGAPDASGRCLPLPATESTQVPSHTVAAAQVDIVARMATSLFIPREDGEDHAPLTPTGPTSERRVWDGTADARNGIWNPPPPTFKILLLPDIPTIHELGNIIIDLTRTILPCASAVSMGDALCGECVLREMDEDEIDHGQGGHQVGKKSKHKPCCQHNGNYCSIPHSIYQGGDWDAKKIMEPEYCKVVLSLLLACRNKQLPDLVACCTFF